MVAPEIPMSFEEITKKRFAVKNFDSSEVGEEKINKLLHMINDSPSSFNIQPWKIIVIKDKNIREKLLSATWNQQQIVSCSHLFVFCADINILENINRLEKLMIQNGANAEAIKGYIKMMKDFEKNLSNDQKLSWAQRQTYIALGNALNGAKSIHLDSCPMEGFIPSEYSKILNLPSHLVPSVLVAIGYTTEKFKPKLRFSIDETFIRK